MVPSYAITSFMSLTNRHAGIYWDTIRDWCALVDTNYGVISSSSEPTTLCFKSISF